MIVRKATAGYSWGGGLAVRAAFALIARVVSTSCIINISYIVTSGLPLGSRCLRRSMRVRPASTGPAMKSGQMTQETG